jgi:hypothetical protein
MSPRLLHRSARNTLLTYLPDGTRASRKPRPRLESAGLSLLRCAAHNLTNSSRVVPLLVMRDPVIVECLRRKYEALLPNLDERLRRFWAAEMIEAAGGDANPVQDSHFCPVPFVVKDRRKSAVNELGGATVQ